MKDNQTTENSPVNKIPDIDPDDMKPIQQISKDLLIEPFTGHKSLESIQKTRSEVEKGLGKIKSAGSRAGQWFSKTRLAGHSQAGVSRIVKDFKDKTSSDRLTSFFDRINEAAGEIQVLAKKGMSGIEEKSRYLTLTLIEKGIELMLQEGTPDWIIERARTTLKRPEINGMEQIRQLSNTDRQLLIDEIYPYNSRTFQKYMKGFDMAVNVGMGAVVATNIPGTGIAMSIVNMGKTLIKIGNRLTIMSAIYGRQISGKTALFKTSASIIGSLSDWESNEQHMPLNPDIIGDLYISHEDDDEAFQSLLNSVIRKDAYIAVPGVGMISLGKINLDDIKMDMLVEHLVQNHHEKNRLVNLYGKAILETVINDYSIIYKAFLQYDCFDKIREMDQLISSQIVDNRWRKRLKTLAGEDEALDRISLILNQLAREIYQDVRDLKDPERSEQIDRAVRSAFSIK